MSSDRTRQRLADIVENIDAILGYLEGMSFARFSRDRKTVDAVERCLQRVTEAVIQIGPHAMQDIAPDVPSAEIRAMGNVLRHGYHRIDLGLIFNTVSDDLPALREACVIALQE